MAKRRKTVPAGSVHHQEFGNGTVDLLLRDVRLLGRAGRHDVAIKGERIFKVGKALGLKARRVIEGGGNLLTPGLVDAHNHLDKGMLTDECNVRIENLTQMIEIMRRLKRKETVHSIYDRILKGAEEGVVRGATAMRTNVEADPFFKFKAVDAALKAQKGLRPVLDLQTIAFPQDGWFKTNGTIEAGCEPYIEEAVRRGIDLVGGNVNGALWPSDPREQVDRLFALAKKYNRSIDAHVDNSDNPTAFTLPYIAQKTIAEGFEGRVTVGHIASLAAVPDDVAARTIALMKRARLNVGVQPTRITVTRVKQLLDSGVNVFVGTDEVMGIYTRIGVADVLMAMWLLSLVTHLCSNEDYEDIFKMGTYNAAEAMGLTHYGLHQGAFADLVLFAGVTPTDVICYQRARRAVIKRGRVVAENGQLVGHEFVQEGIKDEPLAEDG
jgi:cytosine deaminase